MIITRIIQYEGIPEWLEEQLSRSLPDGCKVVKDGTISVLTVGNCPMLEVYKAIEATDEIPS